MTNESIAIWMVLEYITKDSILLSNPRFRKYQNLKICSDMPTRVLKQGTGMGQTIYLVSGHENVSQTY